MKKLQLKLDGKEMLTKEQMKKISGSSNCGTLNWEECWCETSTYFWWDTVMDECDEEFGGLSHTYDYFENQMRNMCQHGGGTFGCGIL